MAQPTIGIAPPQTPSGLLRQVIASLPSKQPRVPFAFGEAQEHLRNAAELKQLKRTQITVPLRDQLPPHITKWQGFDDDDEPKGKGKGKGKGKNYEEDDYDDEFSEVTDFPCKFGRQCKRPGCYYAHPQGRAVDDSHAQVASSTDVPCKFGRQCKRPGCYYAHPQGRAVDDSHARVASSTSVPCKFGRNCHRPDCYYIHPEGRVASEGAPPPKRPRQMATPSIAGSSAAAAAASAAKAAEDAASAAKAAQDDHIKNNLSRQVQTLQNSRPEIGAAWAEYCTVNSKKSKPSLDPSQRSLAFLMKFLRSQKIVPDTGVPENEMLLMALKGATSTQDVVDACEDHHEGLDGLTASLSICLVCKYQSSAKRSAGLDSHVSSLISTVCNRAKDFSARQLVQSICAISCLDASKGKNPKQLADAVLSRAGEFQAEDIARISSAFLKLLVPAELNKVFTLMAEVVAPQVQDLPVSRLVQILKSYSEVEMAHGELLKAVSLVIEERLDRSRNAVTPEELAELSIALWSLGMREEGLMKKIGDNTSKRLRDFSREQLENIEVAYGASGLTIPDEWLEYKESMAED